MSAPLKLTAEDLRNLAAALGSLGELTRTTGVNFDPVGTLQVGIGENTIRVREIEGCYIVDDWNGN